MNEHVVISPKVNRLESNNGLCVMLSFHFVFFFFSFNSGNYLFKNECK